jgi:SOS-response transcriptional repressor LexA
MELSVKLPLKPKERVVFDWLVQYKSGHDGNSPSRREIADGVGIPSTSTVQYYLDRLAAKGWIDYVLEHSRSIEIVGGRWSYEIGGVNCLTN